MKTLKQKTESVLSAAYRGLHNCPGKVKDLGRLIEVNVPAGISTVDHEVLSRLVFACHDGCVRMEILSSGPRRIKLRFSNRVRGAYYTESCPTLSDAIGVYRINHPEPTV